METVIEIKNVTKKFRLYYDKPQTLKEKVLRGGKGPYKDFYALKDISLEIKKGTTVGLVGKNGSGKSTLLKLINRTLFPDSGKVGVVGKVSSLIELGAGFHPDLTGRENIFTNATIFGMSKLEIEAKLPEIIDFSELHDFIDNPVRTYSSGMYARLAFSVAIHVNPEILLVDEILSVGDINFQIKCNAYMRKLQNEGVTIVIVSHDLSILDNLCDYAFLIDKGNLISHGNSHDIHMQYLEMMAAEHESKVHSRKETQPMNVDMNQAEDIRIDNKEITAEYAPGLKHWGNQTIKLRNVKMYNNRNVDKRTFHTGESVVIEYDYICNENPSELDPIFGFGISRSDGTLIYATNSAIDKLGPVKLNDTGKIEWKFPEFSLTPGDYSLQIAVVSRDNVQYDYINDVTQFRIISEISDLGFARLNHELYVDDNVCERKY
ncbi:ABC transporter ATP-binding protein [Paenibacillus sp.]|uniref:ABC transporter ATP-binding protein n=1 Tax=Paenibacillus sp. TaxID=58172 RepID=UPI0028ADA91A|nr:ABC transporter ATP-binding protein [Paenibacillus sp.]